MLIIDSQKEFFRPCKPNKHKCFKRLNLILRIVNHDSDISFSDLITIVMNMKNPYYYANVEMKPRFD